MRALLLVLAFAALAPRVHAADAQGRFAVDGAGAAPCAMFLDARAKRDQRYFMFGGWIDGFFSAMNVYERATFDVTPWQSTDLLAAAVAQDCQRNGRQTVGMAVGAVARGLMRTRLGERSALVLAGTVPIYAATLAQAQGRLRALGHLAQAPSGRWDRPTAAAFSAFQRARRLPVTGQPDQVSLYSLLAARPARPDRGTLGANPPRP